MYFKIFLLWEGDFFKLIFYSILHLEFKNDICTSLKGYGLTSLEFMIRLHLPSRGAFVLGRTLEGLFLCNYHFIIQGSPAQSSSWASMDSITFTFTSLYFICLSSILGICNFYAHCIVCITYVVIANNINVTIWFWLMLLK